MDSKSGLIVKMVIISIITSVIIIFFAFPGVSNIFRYYFPDTAHDIHSEAFSEDNTVKVPFDCVLSVFEIKSMYYIRNLSENYYLLRLKDNRFVYVHIPTADISYWSGVTLFYQPKEAIEYKAEEGYALIGKVKKFTEEEKKQLLTALNSEVYGDYVQMNEAGFTNPDIYIDVIYLKKELIFAVVEIIILLILIRAFIKTFRKYREIESVSE
ncbi:MAG: hypothetical protein IKP88_20745 [Lachnospiraceae bacterium]|nr:hypothetical protein [Lachnospiraceae bacterium]